MFSLRLNPVDFNEGLPKESHNPIVAGLQLLCEAGYNPIINNLAGGPEFHVTFDEGVVIDPKTVEVIESYGWTTFKGDGPVGRLLWDKF